MSKILYMQVQDIWISEFFADVICTCYLVSPSQKSSPRSERWPQRPFGAILYWQIDRMKLWEQKNAFYVVTLIKVLLVFQSFVFLSFFQKKIRLCFFPKMIFRHFSDLPPFFPPAGSQLGAGRHPAADPTENGANRAAHSFDIDGNDGHPASRRLHGSTACYHVIWCSHVIWRRNHVI